jgi:hypothetical protein
VSSELKNSINYLLLSFSPVPGADDVMAEDQVSTPRGMHDAKSSRKVQRQYGEVPFENQAAAPTRGAKPLD